MMKNRTRHLAFVCIALLGAWMPTHARAESETENSEKRVAKVTFVVDAEGRPSEFQIAENESDLPEAAVVQLASRLKYSPAQVGRKYRVPIEINGPMELAAALKPPPVKTADGRPVWGEGNVDSIAVLRSVQEMHLSGQRNFQMQPDPDKNGSRAMGRLIIDEKGKVIECEILYMSADDFGRLATKSLRRLKYNPAQKDGKPVCSWVDQPWFFLRY